MKRIKAFAALALSAVLLAGSTLSAFAANDADDTTISGAVSADGQSYRSELTNEWIPIGLQNQRPVAIMVDNEKIALPHYGVNKADIVYEMMNSTANGRITRLMCIYKDWANLARVGSIRSTRPTNFMVAAEYNAVVVHDGGPYYINYYINLPYNKHLSAGFARFSNGKRSEFTEYVTSAGYKNPNTGKSYAGLVARMQAAKIPSTYDQYYTPGSHFKFSDAEITLDAVPGVKAANSVDLPFPHNSSKLRYNAATRTYDYYEYGQAHIDVADNNKITTFKNVVLVDCSFVQLDAHGYMAYNLLAVNQPGFYLTNGKAIPIAWTKRNDVAKMVFYNAAGQEVTFNTGKTYIAIVPSDVWAQLKVY